MDRDPRTKNHPPSLCLSHLSNRRMGGAFQEAPKVHPRTVNSAKSRAVPTLPDANSITTSPLLPLAHQHNRLMPHTQYPTACAATQPTEASAPCTLAEQSRIRWRPECLLECSLRPSTPLVFVSPPRLKSKLSVYAPSPLPPSSHTVVVSAGLPTRHFVPPLPPIPAVTLPSFLPPTLLICRSVPG